MSDYTKHINGIDISINDEGQGEILILVHGLNGYKESMYPVRNFMKSNYHVITYDARGHGHSEMVPRYTLDDHAEDLIALAMEYGKGGKVRVWGFSMGSYIALAALLKAPEVFEKVILMGTKGDGKTSSVERILGEKGIKMSDIDQKQLTKYLMDATFAPKTGLLKKLGVLRYRKNIPLTEAQKKAQTDALHNFDQFPDMPKITTPVMVLAGEYDGINPPELGKAVADAIPGAKYVLVKDAAHMMACEQPKFVRQAALDFLQ